MSPLQCEVVPMATTSQPNEETQKITRLFHQTKKTLSLLTYNELSDESVEHVLKTFAEYEPNHDRPPFSINDEMDVTADQFNVYTAVQNPKYRDSPNKPEIWLRRFMKAYNVDYVKDSYLEGIKFTQDETTDVSLTPRLWLLKLQGATKQQIQQSLALYRKVLK